MTITLRTTKGAALTQAELDGNFTSLSTSKANLAGSIAQSFSMLNGTVAGVLGVGVTPTGSRALYLAGTRTAEAASARGISMGADLVLAAAANNDVLSGLFIGPVNFSVGTFTGVTQYAIKSTSAAPSELSGNLSLIGASSTLGYGVGSGATVTQATSRTTGVTLNKGTGAVTLFSTTTVAGTFASFTLTNSLIAATDVIIVNFASATSANSYGVCVTAVSAGSCRIQVHNIAAVATAEAPVINFVVIKGAAS